MSKLKLLLGLGTVYLPEPLVALIYAGRRRVVAGRCIDAKAQAASDLVGMIRESGAMPTVEQSREQLLTMARKFERPGPTTMRTEDIMLPGADGERRARLYLPTGVEPFDAAPTLLFLHGGGWIQGAIESHEGLCARLAAGAGVRVISYDYRLAPEHPFPAAVDDVLACYKALVGGQTQLKIDPARLVVGGDSAGGNLTACLMHDIASGGLVMPAAQMLLYPGLDARLDSPSMRDLADQPLLPAARIDWYLSQYIPEGQDWLDPRVSPILSDTLAAQPRALIVAGGHDPLWDDAQSHAKALREAGVEVEQLDFPGQVHAFMSLTKVLPQGDEAIEKTAEWLGRVTR